MGQGGTLGFLGITEQAAGSTNGQREVFATETLQVLGCKLLTQTFMG